MTDREWEWSKAAKRTHSMGKAVGHIQLFEQYSMTDWREWIDDLPEDAAQREWKEWLNAMAETHFTILEMLQYDNRMRKPEGVAKDQQKPSKARERWQLAVEEFETEQAERQAKRAVTKSAAVTKSPKVGQRTQGRYTDDTTTESRSGPARTGESDDESYSYYSGEEEEDKRNKEEKAKSSHDDDDKETPGVSWMFRLYGSNAAEKQKFRQEIKEELFRIGIRALRVSYKNDIPRPPPLCNRVCSGWKDSSIPCSCHEWPEWLDIVGGSHKAIAATTVQDREKSTFAIEPGINILYWRPGAEGKKWWYNGKVHSAWTVQFPTGKRASVVGIN